MKKFLIVAHYSRFLVQFEMSDVHLLQNMGYEIHYATNYQKEDMYADAPKTIREQGVILHQIDFVRSPYNVAANIKAYRELKELMQKEKFSGVHCHTPMAGAIARLAANATNTRPVLYTAHGFHFYKGCPLKNRLIYETAERFLARYTDAQITINQEDYAAAQTFPLRGKAYYIPGVGVDVEKIAGVQVDRAEKRKELGVSSAATVFVTVGELIPRKNHALLISAFLQAQISNAVLLICGSGREQENLQEQIRAAHAEDKVKMLGFRSDVTEILQASDVFVFPSKQEGLPVALMEAMACGLPCVASKIRGNVDLLGEDYNYLFDPADETSLSAKMQSILAEKTPAAAYCKSRIQAFDLETVTQEMNALYAQMPKVKWGVTRILQRQSKRKTLGIPLDAVVFISVGELNDNKNHATAIKAFAQANIPNSYYIICGTGKKQEELKKLCRTLGKQNQVMLLGFRTDVAEILQISDVFVFPSIREGLSVALMEAMACGLPCIASRIRGNVDLLPQSDLLADARDMQAISAAMCRAIEPNVSANEIQLNSHNVKVYSISNVNSIMQSLYEQVLQQQPLG